MFAELKELKETGMAEGKAGLEKIYRGSLINYKKKRGRIILGKRFIAKVEEQFRMNWRTVPNKNRKRGRDGEVLINMFEKEK